ncbi:TetR/AcrR family transcriptional regulator [Nocardioides kongjuensis]|uniref:AcrR family transcriptional regulator n=1 Tax=Nocardioides kongjuensis TaxID=349522 RepID=A0A852RHN6_9ACTN|nr:TetR family transcriptional regulator [Nocardioides kongjuensis]NYD28856.1 AcrR family transcriptional regulator [Nocardioides kongjuensis]
MSNESSRAVQYGGGREALLEATIRVVARAGLRKVTNRAVAEEAGVTHGLVSHHFGNRDNLIAEALKYVLERSLDRSTLESGTGSVDDFARTLVEMATSDADGQAFQYELILESRRRPELRPLVASLYDTYRDATRRELERIGLADLPGLDHAVFAALDGLVFQELADPDPARMQSALEALHDLLRSATASLSTGATARAAHG